MSGYSPAKGNTVISPRFQLLIPLCFSLDRTDDKRNVRKRVGRPEESDKYRELHPQEHDGTWNRYTAIGNGPVLGTLCSRNCEPKGLF
jgi:hypothetical protein